MGCARVESVLYLYVSNIRVRHGTGREVERVADTLEPDAAAESRRYAAPPERPILVLSNPMSTP